MSDIPPVAPPAAPPLSDGANGSTPDPAAWNKAVATGAVSVLGGMMFQMLNDTKSNGEEDGG